MNVLIVGCGKVGAELAGLLEYEHNVSVIAQNTTQLDLLADFGGYSIVGVPIDQDVLKQAGIENCDCLIAVTEDDNINLMVCQMADKFFSVNLIISHVYEAGREAFYKDFHIHTVSSTDLILQAIEATMYQITKNQLISLGNNTYFFSTLPAPDEYLGLPISSYKENTGHIIFGYIDKKEQFHLYESNYKLQQQDKLVLFVPTSQEQ